jgi:hypothetical protein
MNVYFVRTRLECVIATQIQKNFLADQKYVAVFLYQYSRNEDDAAVYETYEMLRAGAEKSHDIVQADGILRNLLVLFSILLGVAVRSGSALLAVINSLPIALCLKLMRRPTLMTFDDGGVNINPNSRYFSVEPLPGTGWKRRALRLLFPKGPAKWMRDQSTRHYTIFPGKENILPADKVVGLDLNWATLLEGADMARLSGEIATVVLGTPHEDYPDPEASRSVARRLASAADLYIRHPREGLWLADPVACNLNSPAEAVLLYLASRQPIRVLHFNSTTGYVLNGRPGLEAINVVDPITRQIAPEFADS